MTRNLHVFVFLGIDVTSTDGICIYVKWYLRISLVFTLVSLLGFPFCIDFFFKHFDFCEWSLRDQEGYQCVLQLYFTK